MLAKFSIKKVVMHRQLIIENISLHAPDVEYGGRYKPVIDIMMTS